MSLKLYFTRFFRWVVKRSRSTDYYDHDLVDSIKLKVKTKVDKKLLYRPKINLRTQRPLVSFYDGNRYYIVHKELLDLEDGKMLIFCDEKYKTKGFYFVYHVDKDTVVFYSKTLPDLLYSVRSDIDDRGNYNSKGSSTHNNDSRHSRQNRKRR